ncbi:zinc-ribbon domain-containing protein [Natronobacterium texcoconense]|uniref:Zinc-ribbon domain-containing protein n=1 Tax=Natronobacterium texcoconense TaxID=1095778 RepID=A0A1H1AXI1_NATTX|nr:zinc-ribbon domain-containing protein [Natronobacterium texcoconense]SDQ44360.1 zinc-ribbon domain-containing protein [Natronobacterium texcoconense]
MGGYCSACGNELSSDSKYCSSCGTPVSGNGKGDNTGDKSQIKKVIKAQFKALNEQNLELYKKTFHPEAGHVDENVKTAKRLFNDYDISFEVKDYEFLEIGDGEAQVRIVQDTRKNDNSNFRDNRVDQIWTFRKSNGNWRFWNSEEVETEYLDGSIGSTSSERSQWNITLGKLVAYPIGLLLLLAGFGAFTDSILGGLLLLSAGALSLPIVRGILRHGSGITFSRWATVAIVLVAAFSGSMLLEPETESAVEIDEPAAEEEEIYFVGENFTEDEITYEVTEVTVDDRLYVGTTRYGTGPDTELVRLRIDMTNEANEEIEVPHSGHGLSTELDFQLVDDQDRTYTVEYQQVTDWDISPGVSEQALFAFEVPDDQEERYLQVGSAKVDLTET